MNIDVWKGGGTLKPQWMEFVKEDMKGKEVSDIF